MTPRLDANALLALGINYGIGCAAGIVGKLGDGMTPHQIARMLDDVSQQQAIGRALASITFDDALSGRADPAHYKAMIEAVCEQVRVKGGAL